MQELLQGIAWTEADRDARLAERRAAVETHPGVSDDLAEEAVFCFETALKVRKCQQLLISNSASGYSTLFCVAGGRYPAPGCLCAKTKSRH